MLSSYRIPLGKWISDALDYYVDILSDTTMVLSDSAERGIEFVETALLFFPPYVLISIFALLAWRISREWQFSIFTVLGFSLIWNIELWAAAMSTLSLVLCATFLTILMGIPLGLLAGMNSYAERTIIPVLDVMQTMPSMVYLIPAIPFFGLGKVAAIFATLIFSLPPIIRMTCLGIRQIPAELIECFDAFGATRWQRLLKLQLPLAAPTILAGINQTVLLALSMVVITAMIGARGLGGEVWKGIQRLDMALGFEAGISIVVIAIFLDRILNKIGAKLSQKSR